MEGHKSLQEYLDMEHSLVVGVAIRGSSNSKKVLKWALEMFMPEGHVEFKLIHVFPKVKNVPTPLGNFVPVSRVREDVVAAHRKELEWQTTNMLHPYEQMCARKNVPVDCLIVESDDVSNAIAELLTKHTIDKLVLGAPANSTLARILKQSVSLKISKSAPRFCDVYAVSEGKLVAVRQPNKKKDGSVKESRSSASSSSTSISQTEIDLTAARFHFQTAKQPQVLSELQVTSRHSKAASMMSHPHHARKSRHLEASHQSSSSHDQKTARKSFFSSPLTFDQPPALTSATTCINGCVPFSHKLPSSSSSHQHFDQYQDISSCFNASSRQRSCGCEVCNIAAGRYLDNKKKLMGQQRKEELEREVAMLRAMLRQEEVMHEILERIHHNDDGSNISIPKFLPQMAKELLVELAMVEGEITRLEGQISQLQNGVKLERDITEGIKARQHDLRHPNGHSPVDRGNQQEPELKTDVRNLDSMSTGFLERLQFETKALHYISRAIRGDYNLNDFSPYKTAQPRVIAVQNESHVLEELKFEDNLQRKIGTVEYPPPMWERSHPSPKRGSNPMTTSDLLPKSISNSVHLDEDQIMQPNKLSESIMQCLIFIYMRLLKTSRAMEQIISGPISKSVSNALSSRSIRDVTSIKSNYMLKEEPIQQDPYGIFNIEGSVPRDVGPYKNSVILTSSSMDAKCIGTLSSNSSVRKLRVLMSYLQKVDLRPLNYQQKLAFWINMYNTCMMHGFLRYGVPSSPDRLLKFMHKARLNIGGDTITAHDIENFILRKPKHNRIKEDGLKNEKGDKETTVRKLYGLERIDPNVTFALCCGTRSSPAVRIYTAAGVVSELEKAKVEYLQASIVITNYRRIGIPELLVRNMLDFAIDINSLIKWVCQQLPTSGALKQLMVGSFKSHGSSKISYNAENIPYDYKFQYLLAIRNINGIVKLAF